MSEEKVIQHTKKAVHAVGDKEKTWTGRIKEFLSEIFIIVIAVSITLWMHNWNDRKHEKEQEKNFLIGIRNNLKQDTASLKYCINFMKMPLAYYDSVIAQVYSHNINAEYINSNSGQLINDLYFVADNGLFESFKSAGNLRLIENQQLLTGITSIYTSSIPFLLTTEQHIFQEREHDYSQYVGAKYGIDSNWSSSIASHLDDPALMFHIRKYDIFLKEMNRHRQDLINSINSVLKDLNKELNDRFDIKDDNKPNE